MGNKGSKTENRKSKKSKSPRVSKKGKKKSKNRSPKEDDGIESLVKTKTLSVTLSCPESPAKKNVESRIDTPTVTITKTKKITKRPSPIAKESSSSVRRKRKKRGNRFSSSSKSSTRSLEPLDKNNDSLPHQKASRNSEILRVAKLSPNECRFSWSDKTPIEPIASLPDIHLATSPDAKFDWGETLVKDDGTSSISQNSVVDHLGSWHSSSAVSIKAGSTGSIVGVLDTNVEVVKDAMEVIPIRASDSMPGSKESNNGAYLSVGSFANEECDSAFMHSEGTVLDDSLDFTPWNAEDNADTPPKKSNMGTRNSRSPKVYSLSDVNILISDSEPKHRIQSNSDFNIVFSDTEPKPRKSTHSSKITMDNDIMSGTVSEYDDVGSVRTSDPLVAKERPNYSKASMEMFKFDKFSVVSNDIGTDVLELSDGSGEATSGFYMVAADSVANIDAESVSVDQPIIRIKKEEDFSGEKTKGHWELKTVNTEEDSLRNKLCVSTFKDQLSYSHATTAIESPRNKFLSMTSFHDFHLSTPTISPMAGDEKPPVRTVESMASMKLDLFRLSSKESQLSEAGTEQSVLMDNRTMLDEQAQDEQRRFRVVITEPIVTVERDSAPSRDRNKRNSDSNFLERFQREKPMTDREESLGSWYPDLS